MYVMSQITSYENLRDLILEAVQVHGTSADTFMDDDFRGTIETLGINLQGPGTHSTDYVTVTEQRGEKYITLLSLQLRLRLRL